MAFTRQKQLQIGNPALQKPLLGGLLGEGQRALVGGQGVRVAGQPAVKIGLRGVSQMVVFQAVVLQEGRNQRQAHSRAVAHGHGHRAVQRHHGRRLGPKQRIVQTHNLRPVGDCGSGGLRMHG